MMRRLAAAVVLALFGWTLTACTPKPVPILALAVRDGKPVGVIVTCPRMFTILGVREASRKSTSPGEPPLANWAISGMADSDLVEVTLFGAAPQGWQVDNNSGAPVSPGNLDVVLDPLTQLRPGIGYSLHGMARYHSYEVDFTTDDLDRIGPDQVLGSTDEGTTKLMSRAGFLRAARGHCD